MELLVWILISLLATRSEATGVTARMFVDTTIVNFDRPAPIGVVVQIQNDSSEGLEIVRPFAVRKQIINDARRPDGENESETVASATPDKQCHISFVVVQLSSKRVRFAQSSPVKLGTEEISSGTVRYLLAELPPTALTVGENFVHLRIEKNDRLVAKTRPIVLTLTEPE